MTDLVERLRDTAPDQDDMPKTYEVMMEAATALEAKDKELAALRAEIAILRDILLNPNPDIEPDNLRLHREKCDAIDRALVAEARAETAERNSAVSFRCGVAHQDRAKELEAKLAVAEQQRDQAREAQELLDWFSKHPKLELSFGSWDEDDNAEWSVHSVGGSRNDREWTLLANRSTPLEAIRAARAITGKD